MPSRDTKLQSPAGNAITDRKQLEFDIRPEAVSIWILSQLSTVKIQTIMQVKIWN